MVLHLPKTIAVRLLAVGIAATAFVGSAEVAAACPYCAPVGRTLPAADLLVTDIVTSPAPAGQIGITVAVHNSGSAAAGAFTTFVWIVNSSLGGDFEHLTGLAAGATAPVIAEFDNPRGGATWLACAWADATQQLPELNDDNNLFCKSVTF
jgi:hypothetical protein